MKTAWRLMIAFMLLAGASAALAADYPVEGQLLTNPGFEIDADEDALPDGWTTDATRSRLQEIVFMGGNNALVSVGETYVLATQEITLEPGETYTASFRARGSGGGVGGLLILHGEDQPTREMPLVWNVPLDDEYAELGRAFVAPNRVARVYVYNIGRTGEVAYDWVSITKGEPTRSWVNTFSFGERDTPITEPVEREGITKWATPLAGGPVRALLNIYTYRTVREVVELSQRFEMDYDLVEGWVTGASLYSPDGRRVMRTMDEDGYEVYVVGCRLDERFEEMIREKVEAGAGLVVISGFGRLGNYCELEALEVADGDHYLMRDLPWDYMPASILNEVRVGQIGEGRVVWLNFPTDVSRVWGIFPVEIGDYAAWTTREMRYWEYWYAFLARAIHYAARGESGVSFTSPGTAPGFTIDGPAGAAQNIDFTWHHSRELRWGEPDLQYETQHATRDNLEVRVPDGFPAGDLIGNVTVRDAAGGAVYWGAIMARMDRRPEIQALELSQEFYAPGDTVMAAVTSEPAPPAGSTLEARLVDAWGRIVAVTSADAGAQAAVALQPAAEDLLTTGHKLFVKLMLDGREIDSAWTDVYFPALNNEAPLQDWHISTWGDGMTNPYITHQYSAMLMDLGFSGKFGSSPYMTVETPLISVTHSRAGRVFTGSAKIEDGVRTPCLSNPEIIEQYESGAAEEVAESRRFGPFAVNLCDEATLSGRHTRREVCFSEWCQPRYREWLREQYGDIAALNASWGTNHANFDEIVGATTQDVRGTGNFAPFVDFRTFMTDVWIDGMAGITEAYETSWPGVRVGHTNTFGAMPTNGNDFWKLCTQCGFEWAQEYSEAIKGNAQKAVFELWRSFLQGRTGEDFPNYGWIGYDHREAAVKYEPWWLALHDSGGVTYYATNSVSAERGKSWALIHPTQSLSQYSYDVQDTLTDLREGVGKALLDGRRADPDVAILWSHASMLVSWCLSDWMQPEPPEGAVDDSYGSWYKSAFYFRLALQELQLMYNYVAPEQVLAGELDRYKVLYLPMTFAISDELADALVEWVEGGGTLIADLQFALTDEHGSPRDGALLERLFGVRRTEREAVYEAATLTGPGGANFAASARDAVETVDAQADASYEDGTPAVIFRELGVGHTIYLNCLMPKYDPTSVEMVRDLLGDAAVDRPVSVDSGDAETPARAWECARYELGAAEIVGLIRDHRLVDASQSCEVSFGRTAHVYDMRAHSYIGETEKNVVTLGPGETAVFAVLPYKVDGMQIVGAGNEMRATVLADGPVGDHVLHVAVTDPAGDPAPAYTRNVSAPGGIADLRIPLALSDAPGDWTVTVRDVLSGAEESVTFAWQSGA